ncbi:HAD-IC family P-type ATPase [Sulfurovum sp.]|uniref:HAD-IC family P-type ATPase n=1 Tax=Sulfurovum sp. TaxID=1969726 RepID=UPI0025D1D2D8|nr:HAD-IC family P-type ATPase [Sulfurovum sp.]
MNDQLLGQFLLLLALLFGLTYVLAGFMERLKIPGILAALFVAMGAHYTPIGDLLSHGSFNEIFTVLAELGVLFLLFFIGLQIDMKEMRSQSGDIILATILNTLFPFLLGAALMLYMDYGWVVAIVIGITRMPTAEAVIVPILDEFGLIKTKIGNYIVGAGVLDDVIEVFLVALVSVWIGTKSGLITSDTKEITDILINILLFTATAWLAWRFVLVPLSHWLKIRVQNLILLTIITLFVFGGFAEYSELGLVVGAIVAGMLMRPVFDAANEEGIRATKAVRAVSYGFFGVIFFLWIGMSVDLEGLIQAPFLAFMLFMADFIGKTFGILLMVPMKKLTFKEALTIGIGLNVRLTTEIIVAKLLFDAQLIDSQLFTALVAASSFSTVLVPLLFSFMVSRWKSQMMTPLLEEKKKTAIKKKSEAKIPLYAQKVKNVAKELGTDPQKGLSKSEIEQRQIRYGPNRIHSVHKEKWQWILFRQFTDVLIIILLIAAAISFAIGEIGDAVTIMIIVILNGILGFIQEFKAEKAIEALQKMLSLRCKVLRNGEKKEVDSTELVPGDIVFLEIGDKIPADLRLIEAVNLKVDESALTGESVASLKSTEAVPQKSALSERSSMTWMGTNVVNGYAKGIVVATGMKTEFGKIAKMTSEVGTTQTPLQKKLAVLGKKLGIFSVGIAAFVAIIGYLLGKDIMEMFLTGISLAVAVVPEGLPAVVTITLALGVKAMVRQKALLRRLQAAEALGSANVICTDKTGTLTQNQMTVQKIWLFNGAVEVTGSGYDPKGHFEKDKKKINYKERKDLLELLKTGLICTHAGLNKEKDEWKITGEPTEASLIVAAYKAWLTPDVSEKITTEFSFNSQRKRMSVIIQEKDKHIAYIKGAPEVLLERSNYYFDGTKVQPLEEKHKKAFEEAYSELARNGLRTLAMAKRVLPKGIKLDADDVENDLVLLGAVGIIDPPRPEVFDAIQTAAKAGINVVMITGDAPLTAMAIAKEVGLDVQHAVTGSELDSMDDNILRKKLKEGTLFARTTPADKMRIVQILQEDGSVTAMTGDGVNDAPALKKADIGIAMGMRGTDVAKGAADMILLDDNFASIINAVREGRRQYDNIKKFVTYLLSSNIGEVIAIFVNILLGGPLILLPVQILWMNLVTDGMTAVALGMEKAEKGTMHRPPRGMNEAFLQTRGIIMILLLGGYIGGATLWIFHHYLASGLPETQAVALAQTAAFTAIIILEKMNVFNYRSLHAPIYTLGFFSNGWLIAAWLVTVSLQVAAVYVPFLQDALHTVPLGWEDWLLIFEVAIPIFIATEIYKIIELMLMERGKTLDNNHTEGS